MQLNFKTAITNGSYSYVNRKNHSILTAARAGEHYGGSVPRTGCELLKRHRWIADGYIVAADGF